MTLRHPYLLFLGDAPDALAAKTADGVARWRRDFCVGQLRLPGCAADLGLPDLTLDQAAALGAATLVVGVANRGGVISEAWTETLLAALDLGMDLAAGLHGRLADVPAVRERAAGRGRRIFDVRHPDRRLTVGTGEPRSGKRLLTVGTDCSVGKMFTALALEQEMKARGLSADFRATGQTGILIVGSGISVDAVVADFISGAVEELSPAGAPGHWDVIEGQGSLCHPSYAGVTLGLVHGAQPDAMVMCHQPGRLHMRGLPGRKLPDLPTAIAVHEQAAWLTNPAARVIGIALNTHGMEPAAAERALKATEDALGLPAEDPMRGGVRRIVSRLIGGAA